MAHAAPERHGERGAVAVEAAFITPVLVLLLFGIMEVGVLIHDNLMMSQAVRSAARTAVAMPRVEGFDDAAAEAAASVLGGGAGRQVEELVIYRADPSSGGPATGGAPSSCVADCVRYRWDGGSNTFHKVSGAEWDAADQQACGASGQNDYVGVEVRARHEWVSGLFGSGFEMTERAVMRLEPKLGGACRPTL